MENIKFWRKAASMAVQAAAGQLPILCLAGCLHAWHSFSLRQRAVLTHGPALPGDPLTDPEIDSRGAVEFWHSHAIISDEARTDLLTCNFSGVGPLNAVPDWQAAPEVRNVLQSCSQLQEGTPRSCSQGGGTSCAAPPSRSWPFLQLLGLPASSTWLLVALHAGMCFL